MTIYTNYFTVPVSYRPFDDRWLYWEATTKLLDEKRTEFFEQVFPGNLFLSASTKSRRGANPPTITDKFSAYHLQDPYALYFPLYTRLVAKAQQSLFAEPKQQLNIKPVLLDGLMQTLGCSASEREAIGVALFYHILAITRAPSYEAENEGYLMQNWPRIPLPGSLEGLRASAALGRQVADLLRPDVPFAAPAALGRLAVPTRKDGGQLGENDLSITVRYAGVGHYESPAGARPGRLWWNKVGYWENVPEEVYVFTIGGYPVLKKWLDYRHVEKLGRPLRYEEARYVSEMVRRIAALLALGPALDEGYRAAKG